MTPEQYQDEACRTESIINNIEGYDKIRLIHGLLGLTSESGEIADTLKRWVYYHQPLDEENLKEEIGDLLWYVALICNTLAMTIDECMEANIRKLRKRFPDKFDVELAKEENRDRESEIEAVTQKPQTSGCKFKVGQVWEDGAGETISIESVDGAELFKDTPQPVVGRDTSGDRRCYTEKGHYGHTEDYYRDENLVRLISEPAEEAEPEPKIKSKMDVASKHVWNEIVNQGFCEGVKLAKEVADMLDGMDKKQALRMIEQREALFMKGDN